MDIVAILALISKGVTVIEALAQAGQVAEPAFEAIVSKVKSLISGAQKGAVTDEELTNTETLLDSLIDDFNIEIPQ